MSDSAKFHDIEWYADVPRSIRKHTTFGILLLLVTFGGFGGWAFTAPLAAAIIAQGRFVATGQNKVVQHFEGGIIEQILVGEGDQVGLDQPLIRLDETAALAKERELFLRRVRLEAIAARLSAQIHGDDRVQYPDLVTDNQRDSEVAPIIEGQNLNFEAWKNRLNGDTALLRQNIEAYGYRAEGYAKQREAVELQLQLLREELQGKQVLLKKELIRATDIKVVQRAIAEATGQIGRLSAEISETEAQIIKERQQIEQTEQAQREAALDELQKIQGELDTVREQSREAKSVLRRATINAPVAGTVIRLFYHTPGGVIESGKGIMEILPADVPLVVEAQVRRTDIDSVRIGQSATLRMTALNQRTTPVLNGTVFYVSADALPGDKVAPGQEFYLARISLPPDELARVADFAPTPGMPVEVLIQTAERTFFSYLTKPIADSMSRAFTEQ
ncbi:HlyD family type I secretion periplasmic adaptor subunit [Pseudaminobacter sp. 19-2017]|uniref:Membrane fusion protein (MFP) family protein n=1 Tax=Pseudaminobacter soli (ex Zhang et al. 2022) TaxID=2831468 RepID=A0A942DVZ7_9HYPH|nr:HlyD family type I secretion periplasmic adaptor subunit [Pseudaminobacter soli]MBS3648579.1 HlyD family type I secretion periplasmic adaptor subunit [Pseudaminobacter soli]